MFQFPKLLNLWEFSKISDFYNLNPQVALQFKKLQIIFFAESRNVDLGQDPAAASRTP